jgi:GNAT superfamily N-acetyltransferase
MEFEVRQATVRDFPAIDLFIREAYEELALYKGHDRWRWQFVDNPFLDDREDDPPVWIALSGDRIVGQIAVQRCGLRAGGRDYRAGWIVDVMILPAFRGAGLGHRLYQGAAESGLALLTLTMAPATRRMADRLGAVTLPAMRQWSRMETPSGDDISRYLVARTAYRPGLQRAVKLVNGAGGAGAIALGARQGVRIRDWLSPPKIDGGYLFDAVERFDDSIDSLWKSVEGRLAGVPRTAQHLNWRFVDCPQLRYERFRVTRASRLVGYLVLRACEEIELRQGIVVDALAIEDDEAVWRQLFAYASQRFAGQAASLEAAFSTPAATRALARSGFLATKSFRPTIVCRDKKTLAELGEANGWFFNRGDHDWDQIHLA